MLDEALVSLAGRDPDFALDAVETKCVRQWLADNDAFLKRAPWLEWFGGALLIAGRFLAWPWIAHAVFPGAKDSVWTVLEVPVVLAASGLGQVAVGLWLLLPEKILGRGLGDRVGLGLAWLGILEMGLGWGAFEMTRWPLPFWLAWPLLTLVISTALFPLFTVLTLPLMALLERLARAKELTPEAYIGYRFFKVFSWAGLTNGAWVYGGSRTDWATSLCQSAACLETRVARALACGDAAVDLKTAAELRKRAAAIRGLAGQMVLGGDLPRDIAKGVRPWLRCACYLDWRSLPVDESGASNEPWQWRRWAKKAGQSLAMLIAPAGMLVAIGRGWIALDTAQKSWANTLLAAWVVLIFVSILDPDLQITNKMFDTINKIGWPGRPAK